jgi:urease accessory protein UreF
MKPASHLRPEQTAPREESRSRGRRFAALAAALRPRITRDEGTLRQTAAERRAATTARVAAIRQRIAGRPRPPD